MLIEGGTKIFNNLKNVIYDFSCEKSAGALNAHVILDAYSSRKVSVGKKLEALAVELLSVAVGRQSVRPECSSHPSLIQGWNFQHRQSLFSPSHPTLDYC